MPSRERPLRIRFAAQSADLPEQSKAALGQLAQRLKDNETPRIQLIAYAEGTAETASQARRLSLQRALALRTYLIDQGVRGNRMDVRALGNKIEDDGPADRVDIIVTER
jgi:outer membrane protein OmpA-like peptidoglycan-associated protein